MDIRKIIVVFIVAILYLVFVLSLSNAIFLKPKYSDYCKDKPMFFPNNPNKNCTKPISGYNNKTQECTSNKGIVKPIYDDNGCVKDIACDYCAREYEQAYESFSFKNFVFGSVFGIIAIIFALFLPVKKNELHKWTSTGFLLGGLLAIFTTTAQYYSHLHRILRPVIIFAELLLVLYLFYSQFSEHNSKKKTKK